MGTQRWPRVFKCPACSAQSTGPLRAPDTPPDVLAQYIGRGTPAQTAIVAAGHRNSRLEDALADGRDFVVARAIASAESLTPEQVAAVLRLTYVPPLVALAAHPSTPPDVLAEIHYRFTVASITRALAANPHTPPAVLEAIFAKVASDVTPIADGSPWATVSSLCANPSLLARAV